MITIGTSIAPKNFEQQLLAVSSWCQLGFNVISVNSQSEVTVLKDIFPMVQFKVAESTGSTHFGKPVIYLDDIFHALKDSGAIVCGIINSDIVLLECQSLPQFLIKHSPQTLIFGRRVDVDNYGSQGVKYFYGRDYFFFDPELINHIPQSIFCLGVPWWDLWLPLVAHHAQFRLIEPHESFAYHKIHDQNWDNATLDKCSYILVEQLVKHSYELSQNLTLINQLLDVTGPPSIDKLHTILDFIALHTSIRSLSPFSITSYTIYEKWYAPDQIVMSFVISDQHFSSDLLLKITNLLEHQQSSQWLELVVPIKSKATFQESIPALLDLRDRFGNISIIHAQGSHIDDTVISSHIHCKNYCDVGTLLPSQQHHTGTSQQHIIFELLETVLQQIKRTYF